MNFKHISTGILACAALLLGSSTEVKAQNRAYGVQQYGYSNSGRISIKGAAIDVGSIDDFFVPGNQSFAILHDLWIFPASGCFDTSASVIGGCQWIEHGKIAGTVGTFAAGGPVTANYRGHFYALNRCNPTCTFFQYNYSNNIPAGRNNYHISTDDYRWYVIIDGGVVAEIDPADIDPNATSDFVQVGIENQDQGVYRLSTNPVVYYSWDIKGTDDVWRRVNDDVLDGDSGGTLDSVFNGNGQISIYQQ